MKSATAKTFATALILSLFTLRLSPFASAQCIPDTLLQSIPNPVPASSDELGGSVAISGNLIVIGVWKDDAGATDAGTAYVFNAATGALVATLNNPSRIVKILPYLEEG